MYRDNGEENVFFSTDQNIWLNCTNGAPDLMKPKSCFVEPSCVCGFSFY